MEGGPKNFIHDPGSDISKGHRSLDPKQSATDEKIIEKEILEFRKISPAEKIG